jgi:3,2-trans-enoyl-CoA isomerase
MNTLQLTIRDKLAIITLDRGRSNPINAEMITELISSVKDIEANDNIAGLIITGKEGFFSAGIDLMEVYNYNEEQSKDFWTNFMLMQTVLINFKKPFVTAITGHSPAGGCIIALCSDYRVMADGQYIIGLNEIPVGIIVPDTVFHLYAFWLGSRRAYQYLLEGKLLTVEDALQDGLIDEVCAAEDVLAAAEKKVRAYMKLNPATWSQSKMNFRKELSEKLQGDHSAALKRMLQQWWAPETRLTLQKIIDKLMNPVKSK